MTASTTSTTSAGPQPARDDIDQALGRLTQLRHHADRYPFTCGALGAILTDLAALHSRCRKPSCPTCVSLRRGLAYIGALDQMETTP